MSRGRVLILGLVTHSGETFRCVNIHQTGYKDTIRRELIWDNLTKVILGSKHILTIISGDMNVVSVGVRSVRDGYSQNPTTVRQRKSADDALLHFSKKIGDTLISPSGPTWRRGDGTLF